MTEGDDGREIVESAPIPIESFRSVYIEMYYFPPDAELTRKEWKRPPALQRECVPLPGGRRLLCRDCAALLGWPALGDQRRDVVTRRGTNPRANQIPRAT
jgi:hypothetical protein